MPPCIDVYVWVDSCDCATVIGRFIDRYVDTCDPGDPRYYAFVRQFVWKKSRPGDREELAEIRRDDARNALSLYVHSRSHYQAIITITEEGGVVLGLSIDDADDDPDALRVVGELLSTLMSEFDASAGLADVELPPPQSRREWRDAWGALLRVGNV